MLHQKLLNFYSQERHNLILFFPAFFGFGAAFYFLFEANFQRYFSFCLVLFLAAAILYFIDRKSMRSFIFCGCAIFLLGSFYSHFYQKIFLNYTKVSGKIYVDGVGKVVAMQKFVNPVNGVSGANLLISQPKLYKAEFVEKKQKIKKKIKKRKTKKAKKKHSDKPKKPRKKRKKIVEEFVETQSNNSTQNQVTEATEESSKVTEQNLSDQPKEPKKKSAKKKKKKKPISEKTILKNFLNLKAYQEIDRQFLDYSKNYQRVEWLKIKDRDLFPNPPPKISLNVIKNAAQIKVNDVIAFRAMLQPPRAKEFPDDFFLDAKFKKIGAYGFVIGETKTMKEAQISRVEEWFLDLREKIRNKISNVILGDEAAIAQAFLIGDQSQISKETMTQIRNSGLAHLLSISGFHLSLASAICFVATRFLLSRSEYLTLRFDLRKFAAISAIFGTYFYLQIAAAPLPAQRAFLMVILVLLAIFIGEKSNSKRVVMTTALVLILLNPYSVFNISFQLTFAAILILISLSPQSYDDGKQHFFVRFFRYFWRIILLSVAIQFATAPFLIKSFHNLSVLGFVANVIAIPFTSFIVMPLGFVALILMPFAVEKYFLILFAKTIFLLKQIAILVANFDYSYLAINEISSLGIVLAICGLLLFCLLQSHLRFLGILVFCSSFLTIFSAPKPDILFEAQQKFFAVRTAEGLIFSKDLKASKQRQIWMNKFGEKEFKSISHKPQSDFFCSESFCEIKKDKKFLVILQRQKVGQICRNNFDVIVNMSKKYKLPDCIKPQKIKIDNRDFYEKGAQFFYFNGEKFTF